MTIYFKGPLWRLSPFSNTPPLIIRQNSGRAPFCLEDKKVGILHHPFFNNLNAERGLCRQATNPEHRSTAHSPSGWQNHRVPGLWHAAGAPPASQGQPEPLGAFGPLDAPPKTGRTFPTSLRKCSAASAPHIRRCCSSRAQAGQTKQGFLKHRFLNHFESLCSPGFVTA